MVRGQARLESQRSDRVKPGLSLSGQGQARLESQWSDRVKPGLSLSGQTGSSQA